MAQSPPDPASTAPGKPGPDTTKGAGTTRPGLRPQAWWLFLLVMLGLNYVVTQVFFKDPAVSIVSYSFFKSQVDAGNVDSVSSVGDTIQGRFKKPSTYPAPAAPPRAPSTTRRRRQGQPARAPQPDEFKTQRPAFADQDLETRLEAQGRRHRGGRRERLVHVHPAGQLRSDAAADRRLHLDQPPHRRRGRGRSLRPRAQPGQALQRRAADGHLRRRGRASTKPRTSSIEIVDFLKNPAQVPAPRRHRAEGRAADRRARNRQDPAGAGDCRAGRRARSSA